MRADLATAARHLALIRGEAFAHARHEDDATGRLVDGLARADRQGWKVSVVVHEPSADGSGHGPDGGSDGGSDVRPDGGADVGADLQLALRLSNGRWVSLLLLAHRLYPDGQYRAWSASRLLRLCTWAARRGHVPGLLLYNGPYGAFAADEEPCVLEFGRCTSRRVTQSPCGMRTCELCRPSPACRSSVGHPGGESPLGITLLPLNALDPLGQLGFPATQTGCQDVDATAAAAVSMPWECLDCTDGRRVTPVANASRAFPYVVTSELIPPWAALVERAVADTPGDGGTRLGVLANEDGGQPRFSVVVRPREPV